MTQLEIYTCVVACVLTMFEKYRLGLSSRKESVILSIRSSSMECFQLVPPPCGIKHVTFGL